ncbi:MAG: ROK family protein [Gammaproteobacteria bacterium]|nr:ROK family protein [Gammaproteobacteria bacterium]
MNIRFGVDLGGTKIELIAIDTAQQNIEVYRKRIATPKDNYSAIVSAIVQLILNAELALGLKGTVGIGIPGALSRKTGRVKNANTTCLIGEDLQGDLSKQLQRPIQIANDANCFTLSEATDGAAVGSEVVFGVIIGTGCGGGVVVNGTILNGVNAIGGEWGHNPLPWLSAEQSTEAECVTAYTELDCYCGLSGCNETFLSGSGLERHYALRAGIQGSVSSPTVQEIVARSEQGEAIASELMDDYVVWLAKGLASVINVIDPDVIVLGGGLSNIDRLYQEVPQIWQQWVFSDRVDTLLLKPKYGDSSGVRGAAWLSNL